MLNEPYNAFYLPLILPLENIESWHGDDSFIKELAESKFD